MKIIKNITRIIFELIVFLLLLSALTSITWISFSFVSYNLDPAEWHWLGRAILLLFFLLYVAILSYVYKMYYEQLNNKN